MIVVGYTADAFGIAAVEHAIAEAALRGTGLLVINATSGEAYVDSRFARSGQVHDVEERLRESGVPFELRQPVGVDAATELLDAMDAADAELLVIGIRHRSPVGKLLLGSAAQQILLEASMPVIAVKASKG